MKKLFKMGCLGFIGIVVLGIIIAVASGGGSDTPAPKENNAPAKQEQKAEAPKDHKITKAEYEAIKVGDTLSGEGGETYEEIVKRFGEPQTKSESQSGDYKLIMADWSAKGDFGANVSITFTNGKVSGKSNFGLK